MRRSQYRMLIQIGDPDKREYYELLAVNNAWTGRELERDSPRRIISTKPNIYH